MILKVFYRTSGRTELVEIKADFSLKICDDFFETTVYADNSESFKFKTAHIKGYDLYRDSVQEKHFNDRKNLIAEQCGYTEEDPDEKGTN